MAAHAISPLLEVRLNTPGGSKTSDAVCCRLEQPQLPFLPRSPFAVSWPVPSTLAKTSNHVLRGGPTHPSRRGRCIPPSKCALEPPASHVDASVGRGDAHKLFDRAIIVVKAGDGGSGAVLRVPRPVLPGLPHPGTPGAPRGAALAAKGKGKGKATRLLLQKEKEKRRRLTQLRKDANGLAILPQGGHGGDVILVSDPGCTTLLPFHQRQSPSTESHGHQNPSTGSPAPAASRPRRFTAGAGGNVDASGSLARLSAEGSAGRTVRIPVPVGTVVKKKRGGKLLADLARPGDELVVARGGRGGVCVYELPPSSRGSAAASLQLPEGVPVMKGWEDRELLRGQPGEEVALELILRVVADVGLVGLPNAGKSSLLAALTAARPAVAPYPFTTLIPNLGKMSADPETAEDGGYALSGPTLADLPGLIRGAHRGKGLGRMFLRHLRRTQVLLHLLDAAAPDPVQDYADLREELRLYNPGYTRRPHVVVLNKVDLPEAASRKDDIVRGILKLNEQTERASLGEDGGRGASVNDAGATAAVSSNTLWHTLPGASVGKRREAELDSGAGDGALDLWDDLHMDREPVVEEEQGRHEAGARLPLLPREGGESGSGSSGIIEEGVAAVAEDEPLPIAIVAISAKEGDGLDELVRVINWAMQQVGTLGTPSLGLEERIEQHPVRVKSPQWQL